MSVGGWGRGLIEGSPSTESSLIKTSITVPAVNAAFYASARSYLVAVGRYSFSTKEFISITSPVGCRSFRSNIDTRINGTKSLRHVPLAIPCCLPSLLRVRYISLFHSEEIGIYFYIICENRAKSWSDQPF